MRHRCHNEPSDDRRECAKTTPVGAEAEARHSPAATATGGVQAAADYSHLATPSVWRHGRTQAAAKVDALASNGMDEIEIPAFLRKQAD